MIEVSSEQSISQYYMYTECCCRCRCCCCCWCCCSVCVPILLLQLQQQCCCFLLRFVIVCRMAKIVAGPLNLLPMLSFSSFKRDLFLMYEYPLAVLSHLRPRFAYMLGNYGHARSQGGRHPAPANTPL